MRVLITGATGFLGNNLARILCKEGQQVVAAIRPTSSRAPLAGLPLELAELDWEDGSDLGAWVAEVDVVVHAAALIQLGWSRLEESRRVNVDQTVRLAQAARLHGKRMILVSSVDALGVSSREAPADETHLDPPHPACSYVVSKREAETAFLLEVAQGLDGLIVNPGFLLGPYDWRPSSGEMMLTLHRQYLRFAPGGGCSAVDVRDVAAGIASALIHGRTGQRYILGGHNITYFDLWCAMARHIGQRPPRRRLPNWIAAAAGGAGDLISRFRKEETLINSAATRMGQIYHWYRSDKAQRELGYQIGPLDTALADAWEWFVAHGYTQ